MGTAYKKGIHISGIVNVNEDFIPVRNIEILFRHAGFSEVRLHELENVRP